MNTIGSTPYIFSNGPPGLPAKKQTLDPDTAAYIHTFTLSTTELKVYPADQIDTRVHGTLSLSLLYPLPSVTSLSIYACTAPTSPQDPLGPLIGQQTLWTNTTQQPRKWEENFSFEVKGLPHNIVLWAVLERSEGLGDIGIEKIVPVTRHKDLPPPKPMLRKTDTMDSVLCVRFVILGERIKDFYI